MTVSIPLQPMSVAPQAILPPARNLFELRAARFRSLAVDHPRALWLAWLAELAHAQQSVADRFAGPTETMPQDASSATLPPIYMALIEELLNKVEVGQPPALAACADIAATDMEARIQVCMNAARGMLANPQREITDILVAASLQIHWHFIACQMIENGSLAHTTTQTCPCCGSAPVASIVFAGEGRAGLRYLECSLCATRWNAVRAHCTLCAGDSVVSYFGVEDGNPAIQAEICLDCHGYIKTFFQSKDFQVEPTADDLASLELDVLVAEQGYGRGAPNLYLCEIE